MNTEFKRLHNDVKSFLSLQTRKDVLECRPLGLEGSRESRNVVTLVFCGGWAQTLLKTTVIVGIQWPASSAHLGDRAETHQISCPSLWHRGGVE